MFQLSVLFSQCVTSTYTHTVKKKQKKTLASLVRFSHVVVHLSLSLLTPLIIHAVCRAGQPRLLHSLLIARGTRVYEAVVVIALAWPEERMGADV